jgi:hypothetical protein
MPMSNFRECVQQQLEGSRVPKKKKVRQALDRYDKLRETFIWELHGVDTGNPAARQLAQSWREAMGLPVDLFKQAGGALYERRRSRRSNCNPPSSVPTSKRRPAVYSEGADAAQS